ncbi:MAG TPA: hypothetical protein VNK03_06685 [Gammaproteobacteria bacterium]|nr:hypothetical protein [Gammaproteobacteria bacterium]
MKFNQIIVLVCCASMVMSGCAGRASHPIMTCQPGDNEKSCSNISSEMIEIEGEINKRLPKEKRTGQNVALGVAGVFLIVPWFFMNFSEAEKIEINAYRTRYNHLARIYNDKHCGSLKQEIPSFEKQKAKN